MENEKINAIKSTTITEGSILKNLRVKKRPFEDLIRRNRERGAETVGRAHSPAAIELSRRVIKE